MGIHFFFAFFLLFAARVLLAIEAFVEVGGGAMEGEMRKCGLSLRGFFWRFGKRQMSWSQR